MNKYYVYQHTKPGLDKPFYIGKGAGRRYKSNVGRNDLWKRIVDKHGFETEILQHFDNENEAFDCEIRLIAIYKKIGACEANFSFGGEGPSGRPSWNKGKSSWSKGLHLSESHRKNISMSHTGIKKPTGIDSKSYKKTDDDYLIRLYKIGFSTVEIANGLKITYTTVWNRLKKNGIDIRKPGKPSKSIICSNDMMVFKSIADASRHYNVFGENIRKVLSGKYKHTNNLKFNYHDN